MSSSLGKPLFSAMSPALSAPLSQDLDGVSRARLDRALVLGDVDTLRDLGVPCPLAVFAGDIPRLLAEADQLGHPLYGIVSSLLSVPCPDVADVGINFYVAAIAVLNSFLRVNFAGPPISPASIASAGKSPVNLTVDGEEAAAVVKEGHLLLAAEAVLVHRADALVGLGMPCARWWAARTSIAHHLVLARPTSSLHSRIFGSFAALLGADSSALGSLRKSSRLVTEWESKCDGNETCFSSDNRTYAGLEALANIELCTAQQQFYDTRGATTSLMRACDLLGVAVDVRGRLGVRTKFQQTPLSQLVTRVHEAETEVPREPVHGVLHHFPRKSDDGAFSLPANVPLDDSDVLGYIKLVPETEHDEGEGTGHGREVMDLTPLEQALVLGFANVELSRNASHTLTDEQAAPYVARVLSSVESAHGSSSPLQIRALLLRTRFERDRGRYMERNMMQMESIGNFIDASAKRPRGACSRDSALLEACERIAFLFASGMPARWEVKKELAVSFGRLGLVKSAMEIFRELEFWEELVDCHRLIGDTGAAEELVREQLLLLDTAVAESSADDGLTSRAAANRESRRPRMLCVLGDVTRNPALYEQAWEESRKRCGRAKRSLGRLAVERCDWAEAISHLREALKLNSLMPDVWFTCGCACIEDADLSFAAICFTHVVQETPDNGEAWNNLGRVLCDMNRKKEGLSALLQAAKYKRESWRIWDNVLTVATAVRSSDDIILAMGKLVELRGKDAVSAAPLLIAVDEVAQVISAPMDASAVDEESARDARANATGTCRSLLQLLARVTTLVASDPLIWAAYARLHDLVPGKESRRKSAECRQRQIRTLMAESAWKSEPRSFQAMADASLAFACACVDSEDNNLIYAATLHVKSVIAQTHDLLGTSEHFNILREAEVALCM